mmetsp:Transcript_72426/g.235265  ORF Transcript_72426/g.235265 Transcript_72426/m.235265 type:complete len:240 (-) Transcript_72426:437-1156(-)
MRSRSSGTPSRAASQSATKNKMEKTDTIWLRYLFLSLQRSTSQPMMDTLGLMSPSRVLSVARSNPEVLFKTFRRVPKASPGSTLEPLVLIGRKLCSTSVRRASKASGFNVRDPMTASAVAATEPEDFGEDSAAARGFSALTAAETGFAAPPLPPMAPPPPSSLFATGSAVAAGAVEDTAEVAAAVTTPAEGAAITSDAGDAGDAGAVGDAGGTAAAIEGVTAAAMPAIPPATGLSAKDK